MNNPARTEALLAALPAMDDMSPKAQNARLRGLRGIMDLAVGLDKVGKARLAQSLSVIVARKTTAEFWLASMSPESRILKGLHL